MNIVSRSLLRTFWVGSSTAAAILVASCGLFLGGCGDSSSSEGKDVKVAAPTATEVEPPEEELVPKGAKLLSKETLVDYYPNRGRERERRVSIYEGGVVVNDGKYEEFYPDGTPLVEGTYKDGKKSADWSTYYKNGKLARREHYERGKLDGSWTNNRENGTPSEDVSYKNGKRDGLQVEYDEAGKPISKTEYKNGLADGLRTEFYSSGKKKAEGRYVNGKYDGLTTTWREDGSKLSETNWKMGNRHGKEIEFNEREKPVTVHEYNEGHLLEK